MNCIYCGCPPKDSAGTCDCVGANNARERKLGPEEVTPTHPHMFADVEALALRARVAELEARQTEHLALIARLSREMPYEDEVKQLHSRIGALMAEVGTLRAKIANMKAFYADSDKVFTEMKNRCAAFAGRISELTEQLAAAKKTW